QNYCRGGDRYGARGDICKRPQLRRIELGGALPVGLRLPQSAFFIRNPHFVPHPVRYGRDETRCFAEKRVNSAGTYPRAGLVPAWVFSCSLNGLARLAGSARQCRPCSHWASTDRFADPHLLDRRKSGQIRSQRPVSSSSRSSSRPLKSNRETI